MTIKEELIQYAHNCLNDLEISEYETYKSCKKHKQACKRLLNDFKREETDENYPWKWNEEEAQKIVKFFTYLRHSKGIIAGEPIRLTAWQKFIICPIYAWLDDDENRKIRKVFVEVARKNGKSQIIAGLCLYEMSYISVKYREMNECYCAGVKREQSKIIFDECQLMLNGSPLKPKFRITRDKITHVKTGSFLKPLAKEDSKSGDGTNPQTTALDELHLHKDSGFYDMHETGCKARKNPLLICITTAGFDLNSFCYTQEYKYCSSIIDENVDVVNDRYHIDILEIDEKDDLTLENIKKANPILSTYKLGIESILQSLQEAKDIPEKMTAFLTKTCDKWIQQKENGYMDMAKWKRCEVSEIPVDTRNMDVYVGFDLSAKIDLTSVAFIIPIKSGEYDATGKEIIKYICYSHSFIPNEEKLRERTLKDKVPYDAWARMGYITLTNTEIVDQNVVMEYVLETCRKNEWNINTLCFDPANASKIMIDLSNEGYPVEEVYQSHRSLNESTAGFREQVYQGNILYLSNPVLNFSMANAVIRVNQGLIKIDKDATTKRIDPVDAMLCAFKLALYHEFYDGADLESWLDESW